MDLVQSGLVACLGPSLIACLAVLAGGCLLHRRFAWLRPLSLAAPLMLVAGFLYLGLPACQPELAAQALPYLRAAWYFGLASLAARLLDAALIGHLLIRVRGRSIPGILRSLFLILAHFLAALWVLRVQLDLDVTSLLATSAVVSFVVGLASQDLLGSILAGIVIGVERPISPGDWVRVDGVEGRVVDATWRRCRVMTRDGAFVLIPNATVMKGTVTNYTMPDRRHRLSVPLGVHYRHPPSQVKQALLEAAATCQAVLADPPPSIFLTGFGDSAINYRLNAWIADYGAVEEARTQLNTHIWYCFRRAGLEIPYPIRTIQQAPSEEATRESPLRMEHLLKLLTEVEVLADLDETSLRQVAQAGRALTYGHGELVCREGEASQTFFLVLAGELWAERARVGEAPLLLGRLGPGDCFGEVALLLNQPRGASVRAARDSELLALDAAIFRQLATDHPDFLERISRLVEARQHQNAELLALYAQQKADTQASRVRVVLRRIREALGVAG